MRLTQVLAAVLLAAAPICAVQTTIPTTERTQPWKFYLEPYGTCSIGGPQIYGANAVLSTEILPGQTGFNFAIVRDSLPTMAWVSTTTPAQVWGISIDADGDLSFKDFTQNAVRVELHNGASGALSLPFLVSCGKISTNSSGTLQCVADTAGTVREVDTSPSVSDVTVLEFDQGDGFVLTNPSGTTVRVDLSGIPDAAVSDTLTSSLFAGSGSTTTAVDLGTAEVAGQLTAAKGGTGDDTSATTGVPRIASGNWTYDAGVSHLAASTSADFAGVCSNETGSGALTFGTQPTITDFFTVNRSGLEPAMIYARDGTNRLQARMRGDGAGGGAFRWCITDSSAATDWACIYSSGLQASQIDDGGAASTQVLFSGGAGAAGFRAIADPDVPDTITASNYLPLAGGTVTGATALDGTVAFSGDINATISANTDNWAPTGLSNASTIRITTSSTANLTGITGGADGRVLLLHNLGGSTLTLKDETTSTAANRFALTADVSMAADAVVALQYDSTTQRWRMIGGSGSGGGGTVDGSGTADYIPMWTDSDTLGDSYCNQSGDYWYCAALQRLWIGGTYDSNPYDSLHFEKSGQAQIGNWSSSEDPTGAEATIVTGWTAAHLGDHLHPYVFLQANANDGGDEWSDVKGLLGVAALDGTGTSVAGQQVLGFDGHNAVWTVANGSTTPQNVLDDGAGAATFVGSVSAAGFDAGGAAIANVGAPSTGTDAATKDYVDTVAAGCKGMLYTTITSASNSSAEYHSFRSGTANATLTNVDDTLTPNASLAVHHMSVKVDTTTGSGKSWTISLCDDATCTGTINCVVSNSTTCTTTSSYSIGASSKLAWLVTPSSTPAPIGEMLISVCTTQ